MLEPSPVVRSGRATAGLQLDHEAAGGAAVAAADHWPKVGAACTALEAGGGWEPQDNVAGFGNASRGRVRGRASEDDEAGAGATVDRSGAGATPRESLGGATGFCGVDAPAVSAGPWDEAVCTDGIDKIRPTLGAKDADRSATSRLEACSSQLKGWSVTHREHGVQSHGDAPSRLCHWQRLPLAQQSVSHLGAF